MTQEIRQRIEDGLAHHRAGRLREAVDAYQEVLALEPQHASALNLLGVIAIQTGEVDSAIDLLRRSIGADGRVASVHNNLGEALRTAGRLDEATEFFRSALALNPNSAAALNNLGLTLLDQRRVDQAVMYLRRAVALRPADAASHPLDSTFAQAHSNLGAALMDQDAAGAAENYRRAIELNPSFADAHTNLGELLRRNGETSAAVELHRRAIQIEPRFAPAYLNLGMALQSRGDVREAIAAYRQALALSPHYRDAHDNLLLALHYESDLPPEELFEEHIRWAAIYETPGSAQYFPNVRDPERRLRIGYVSGDFREHAVARFIEPVFEHRDAGEVESFCYSNTVALDATSLRLRGLVDQWRDVVAMDDDQIARQVRDDQIDILIDLSGHTALNRLGVMARRPAPVQATYLGYPNTTGVKAVDWKITDAAADPTGIADSLYAERLMRLDRCAWCYRPPDDSPEIAAGPTGDAIVFGSFNAAAKVGDQTLRLWADVLKAVPGSRMVLKFSGIHTDDAVRTRIDDALRRYGVDPTRLELLPAMPSAAEHLRAYGRMHIALDTFPYHGVTTTCEALWMGVPVVTLAGRTHVSRVGASLLPAAGFPEWVARDPAQFVSIASQLAGDREALDALRKTMRQRLRGSVLLDAASMAQAMQEAYRRMWHEWCAVAAG